VLRGAFFFIWADSFVVREKLGFLLEACAARRAPLRRATGAANRFSVGICAARAANRFSVGIPAVMSFIWKVEARADV